MNRQKVAKTATYTKVLDRILVKIQSNFAEPKYALKSIRDKQKFMPVEPKRTRIKLEGTDDEKVDQTFHQQTCNMDYREERSAWTMEKKNFEQDMSRTYGIIYGSYCTNEMQVAIKEDSKFESEVRDDPLKLLALISTLMYTTVRAIYPINTLADTLSSMFSIRQDSDEKFTDFLEKFQQ